MRQQGKRAEDGSHEIVEKEKEFRANRKRFYITYPKCELSPERVLELLEEKCGEVAKYLIAREEHKDGTHHIHAYIEFKKKKDFRSCRYADLLDIETVKTYHGNDGGSVRNEEKVVEYCSKDGNYITNFWSKNPWDNAIVKAEEGNVKEAIEILKRKSSREFIMHRDQIIGNLKNIASTAKRIKLNYTLDNFVNLKLDLSKAVLLWGKSNTGKTTFAISHFRNPLIVCQIDDLKQLSPEHDGIVFDDFSLRHWPATAIIHILDIDLDRSIKCRHSNAIIPAGMPRIFTHNDFNALIPKDEYTMEQLIAIQRRYIDVEVNYDLRKCTP